MATPALQRQRGIAKLQGDAHFGTPAWQAMLVLPASVMPPTDATIGTAADNAAVRNNDWGNCYVNIAGEIYGRGDIAELLGNGHDRL